MAQDTRELVTRASQGDAPAVDELLERFLPGLEGHLRREAGRLVGAKESTADLAQSVCREVLERLADERLEYRGEAEFRSWLYQAAAWKLQARHRFYLAGKRDARREVRPGGGSEEGGAEHAHFRISRTPSQDAMERESGERFQAAFRRLPERYREVVQLAVVDERPHAEVAQRLGISESHSRVLLSRALARLAKLGDESGSSPGGK